MADADLVAFLSGLERRQRPRAAIFDNTQSGPRVCNIPHSDDEGQESGKIQRFKNLWLNIIRLKFVEKCPKIFLKKIQNERTIECVATFHSNAPPLIVSNYFRPKQKKEPPALIVLSFA